MPLRRRPIYHLFLLVMLLPLLLPDIHQHPQSVSAASVQLKKQRHHRNHRYQHPQQISPQEIPLDTIYKVGFCF
uniref:Secreted protein n=1 Tax=Ditylenchus dipsaci TaxID=166011 RepID=A0A915D2I5_9BILA